MSEEWNCDFCGKEGLSITGKGFVWCRECGNSYQQSIYDLAKELSKKRKVRRKQND